MAVRTAKNGNWLDKTASFLKEYWYIVLGAIFILPVIYRYIRNTIAKLKNDDAQIIKDDPELLQASMNGVTNDTQIQAAANAVYAAFGLNSAWWNYNYWSENEEAAYLAITGVYRNGKVPQALIDCYSLVSGKRNLLQDCQQYLSDDYFNRLHW